MGEGTVFSLSVHTGEEGSEVQVQVGGVPGPGRGGPRSRSRWGGTWSQVSGVCGPGGGVPGLRSRGGTRSQ